MKIIRYGSKNKLSFSKTAKYGLKTFIVISIRYKRGFPMHNKNI